MKFEFDKYPIPSNLKVYSLPTEANNGQILETSYNPEYIVVNGVTQSATYSFSGVVGGDPLGSPLFYQFQVSLDGSIPHGIPSSTTNVTDNNGNVISGFSISIIDSKITVTHTTGKYVYNLVISAFVATPGISGGIYGPNYNSIVSYPITGFNLTQHRTRLTGGAYNPWSSFSIDNINSSTLPEAQSGTGKILVTFQLG